MPNLVKRIAAAALASSAAALWVVPAQAVVRPTCVTYSDGHSYNCTGSPMGYMIYNELGNTALSSVFNTGPFKNLASAYYWSSTGSPLTTSVAWTFYTSSPNGIFYGFQDLVITYAAQPYAVAVRPGDVLTAVPEPQTWAMLLAGLSTVAVALRRGPK